MAIDSPRLTAGAEDPTPRRWLVGLLPLVLLAPGCLGLDLDPTWDEYRKRRMIEGASALFQQRWLKQGLYAYFRIATASAAVRPRVAVVSVGAANRYLFPHAEALDRWRAVGAAILRTDEGAVLLRSDGHAIRREPAAATLDPLAIAWRRSYR